MFILRITGPREGSSPALILAQQDLRVRLDREQDAPERLSPEMTPSEIGVAILVKLLQRRTVDPRIHRLTALPLVLMASGP